MQTVGLCISLETTNMPVDVHIKTHRTCKVAGKEVTEYSVSASGDDRDECLSWHRYTDFRVLHERCAADLGLNRWFPVPKALMFTDTQRQERADELHGYLQGCVAAAGGELPPALQAFLFTPTNSSTTQRSQSIADMSPFVTSSPFLLRGSLEEVMSTVPEGSPALSPAKKLARQLSFERQRRNAKARAAEDSGLAQALASADETADGFRRTASADRMRNLAAAASKAEAVAAAQAEATAAAKAEAEADKMR